MKKIALRAMLILAIVVALAMFFSGTIRTLTTPKVRFLKPRQGKFEQVTEMTGSISFPAEEELRLTVPEGVSVVLTAMLVQAGDRVEKGTPLFRATVTDLEKTLNTLQSDYDTARDALREAERKNGEIRLSRNEQAWKEAYETAAKTASAKRDARVALLSQLAREELEPEADGQLPPEASEEARALFQAWQEADGKDREAEARLKSLDRYAIEDTVWNDMTQRAEYQAKMADAEEQMTTLRVLSDRLASYAAPHAGYITSVPLEKGSVMDAQTVVLKMTPEDTEPLIRTDISALKQTVAKGAAVQVIIDQWSTYDTRVTATGINSDATRYADIALNEDIIQAYSSVRNMMKNDIRLKLTTRADTSTCLIPATAVRGNEGDRYVYVAVKESSTFGGTQTRIQKTTVTVLHESSSVVSVSEDLSYQQLVYQEDRPLTENCTVMAYSGEENG